MKKATRGKIQIVDGKVVTSEERLDERSAEDTSPRLVPGQQNGAVNLLQIQTSKDATW